MSSRWGFVVGGAVSLAVLGACTEEAPASAPSSSAPSESSPSESKTSGSSTSDGTTSVTISAAGDLLPHSSVIEHAAQNASGDGYDFSPMFENVKPTLSASDLSLCHVETPISPDNRNLTQPGVLSFNSPHELVDAVKGAGFDGCDFASNHVWDREAQGVTDTRTLLTDAGLGYAGPTVTKGVAARRATHRAGGARVDHLAYTYTLDNSGTPTTDVPPEAPALGASLWPKVQADGILADARTAKQDGAEFVVVSMHWGEEYTTAPTEEQRRIAEELLESEHVDLILGTHAHVVQPCETINDKHVIYGMGNLLSNQSPTVAPSLRPETQEGMVATFELTKDADGEVSTSMTYQPTRVDITDHEIQLATPSRHAETYDRVVGTMDNLGEDACDAEPAR